MKIFQPEVKTMQELENVRESQPKKEWLRPELIEYGSVEEITLGPKGWGNNEGMGLEPGVGHPSL